jgi:serine/threonine protein kinase
VLSQLGPYLIDEELAQGGMARVFRARLRGLGGFEKVLVIKQIRPELAKDPRFVELFVREANTLVSLSHPHIVPVYELGAAEGTYYLSMEYVEGATVLQMLDQGPLAPALVAHVGTQVSEALE